MQVWVVMKHFHDWHSLDESDAPVRVFSEEESADAYRETLDKGDPCIDPDDVDEDSEVFAKACECGSHYWIAGPLEMEDRGLIHDV